MPDGGVHADPDAVRALASALARYQREVNTAGRAVTAALARANWHDRQKQQFEERYRELQHGIDRFMATEAQSMIVRLNDLARRLDEIRSMRI
jgi:hypothetical protein